MMNVPRLDAARPVPVRLVAAPRSYAQETLLLLHAPRLALVLALATIGTFLAPHVDMARFVAELAFLVLGVGLAAYRLDEIKDRTTAPAIPAAHHRIVAAVGLAGAIGIGLWAAWRWSPWLLVPLAAGVVGIAGYNFVAALHTPGIYALTWGALPVWASFSLQTLQAPSGPVWSAGVAAGAFALLHLWTWGLRRCGRASVCAKPQNALRGGTNGACHSRSIACATRLTMPEEVNAHAKTLLRLQYAMIAGWTAWVVLGHVAA